MCVTAAAMPWGSTLASASSPSSRLDPRALARMEHAIASAVNQGLLPGAVVRVERSGAVHEQALGMQALEPQAQALDVSAVFDAASLTKVVVTTPVVLRLLEQGALRLSDPVRRWLPEFESHDEVTVAQLLTHTSGLPAGVPQTPAWVGEAAGLHLACTRPLTHAPGTFFRYSDVNFILLGHIAQRVAAKGLAALAQDIVLGPLKMHDSGFLPLDRIPIARLVPTEWVSDPGASPPGAAPGPTRRMLRGEVHDPTARRMAGVAGHAGLFTTAADLSRYARMVLGGGALDGVRVLAPDTVARMTAVATPATLRERRGLGWDIDSPFSRARGRRYPLGSVGHTGFTGCALWLDPASGAFHVFLSNRVHPIAREPIVALYEEVATAAAEAALGPG